MKYFSLVGSYEGGIKVRGKWVHVDNLNHVNKVGWDRHQGPLTPAMAQCLRQVPIRDADWVMKNISNWRTK